jgi:hypothetical protein
MRPHGISPSSAMPTNFGITKVTYDACKIPLTEEQIGQVKTEHQSFLKKKGLIYSANTIDEMVDINKYLPNYLRQEDGSKDLSFYYNCLD